MEPSALRLPACPLPRPGDTVLWYQDSLCEVGKLLGHAVNDLPYVRASHRGDRKLDSFDSVRLRRPGNGIAPMWHRLPRGGTLTRPRDDEQTRFEQFLERTVPSGISHGTVAKEIWNRGYEVFLSGVTVRKLLAESSVRDAEFVTTMPIGRVCGSIIHMYGRENVAFGDADRFWGRLQVGGVTNKRDEIATIRVFRYENPGKLTAVFGGCFERDVQCGDLACHAVFYDPINKVFVDPTGRGFDDAVARRLSPVFDRDHTPADVQATIGLRIVGLTANGYFIAPEHDDQVTGMLKQLPALTTDRRIDALRAEIFDVPGSPPKKVLWEHVHETFADRGLESLWVEYIAVHQSELLA